MTDSTAHVHALIKKAAEHERSDDAMKFAQAALNAANALAVMNRPEPQLPKAVTVLLDKISELATEATQAIKERPKR